MRIFSITGASKIAAMILSSPPQFGQCSMSISNTHLCSYRTLDRGNGGTLGRVTIDMANSGSCAVVDGRSGPSCVGRVFPGIHFVHPPPATMFELSASGGKCMKTEQRDDASAGSQLFISGEADGSVLR